MVDARAVSGHAGRAMRTLTPTDPQQRSLFACLPSEQVLDHIAPLLEPESLLSESEMARAKALTHPDSRSDFVAARLLTRLLLRLWHSPGAGLASIADIVLAQSCARCGGPHGRPADVFGLGVSWAHAGGFVAAAVGPGRVGVDVEPARADRRADRPAEGHGDATSLRAWVRAEAIVKWGHGSLDEAQTWLPHLDRRLAPRGRRFLVDDQGAPHPARRRAPRVPGLVITDAPAAIDGAVCSVAAGHAACWVNPLN